MAYRYVPPRADVGNGITDFGGAQLFFYDFGTLDAKVTYSDFALTVPNTLNSNGAVFADADGLFPNIFLDIQASVTLQTSNDVTIFGPERIYAPDDSITALAAALVSVLDTGGNFTATNVETVLAEISDGFLRLNRASTVEGTQTFSGANIAMADNEIGRAVLTDYGVKHNAISSVAGTLTLDLTTGNSFVTTLTENTTIVISKPPATGTYGQLVLKVIQDGAGGAYTVTYPASVIWPSATAPVMTVGNNGIDEVTLRTIDAGTEWRGSFSQAFA